MSRPLRVLWASDAPWAPSGYGVQTKLVAPYLARHCDLALLTTFGLHGGSTVWEGIPTYPGGADPFANDVIAPSARDWRADIVFTLKDTFVFKPEAFAGLRWCPLIPVDHEPVPPGVVNLARASYRPIAYAPNGLRELRRAGLDPLYAPHAYDSKVFYPDDRSAARGGLGLKPEQFVIATVAVNRGGVPSRKAWPQLIEGVAQFMHDVPEAVWFVHTNIADDGYEGGIPLRHYANEHGIAHRMIFCDQDRYKAGFPDDYLRGVYNAADVLLAPSLGEGFGVPTLEAQACGTPVIVGNWAAQADLVFGGWKIPKIGAFRFPDNQMSYVYIPQPKAIAQSLHMAYAHRNAPALRTKAVKGAAAYEIGAVVKRYWVPLLKALAVQIVAEPSRGVLRIIRPEEVLG